MGGGLGWRNNNMGHSGWRVGTGIQRRVRAERRGKLHHRRGEAEENGSRRGSRAQLLHFPGSRQTSALSRQHRLPEKEGGCLPIRRSEIRLSLALESIINKS